MALPPDLSHGRISTLTKSYVLSPFTFEVENTYTGSFFRHGTPAGVVSEEIEMGLPARFTMGIRNQFGHFASETAERSFTLEARYAFANWNKLPLNPAISAEYRFGLDQLDDSAELALLVSHDFPHLIEWAMNIFLDREFNGRTSTAAGFAQSVEIPILLPEEKLKWDSKPNIAAAARSWEPCVRQRVSNLDLRLPGDQRKICASIFRRYSAVPITLRPSRFLRCFP